MFKPDPIVALLQWYREIGVDEAVTDAAFDRTAAQARPAPPVLRLHAEPEPAAPLPDAAAPPPLGRPLAGTGTAFAPAARLPLADPAAVADARSLAAAATTLTELEAALRGFDGCALKLTATHTVFADGNPAADIMVVGEAPGAEEDRQGKPFVGPAGLLLDRMLAAIGLDRTTAYISNVLFWRPPGNRQPNPGEIALCLPFVERHVVLKAPRLLILAGGTSAKALLGSTEGITRLRGRWAEYHAPGLAAPVPAIAVYHPAYLLRQPALKRDAWRDLVQIRKKIDSFAAHQNP